MLQQQPDLHETVVCFHLKRMHDRFEKMYEIDGGEHLAYEYYAEGLGHLEEEMEEADFAMSSAAAPQFDDIPDGQPGPVPYNEFDLTDVDTFFSDSATFLSRYSGEGQESDAWRAARTEYLSYYKVYSAPDTHAAHARWCVHRAKESLGHMDNEFQQREGAEGEEFYGLGQRDLNDLYQAEEFAVASAPDVSIDERAQRGRSRSSG